MKAKSPSKSALRILPSLNLLFAIEKLFVGMLRENYHPNAYLADFRNNRLGLKARTTILDVLEKGAADMKTIARETGLSYSVVKHHLQLLEAQGIVRKMGGRPSSWALTGLGQKRLQL